MSGFMLPGFARNPRQELELSSSLFAHLTDKSLGRILGLSDLMFLLKRVDAKYRRTLAAGGSLGEKVGYDGPK